MVFQTSDRIIFGT